jgi:hypothetical protein
MKNIAMDLATEQVVLGGNNGCATVTLAWVVSEEASDAYNASWRVRSAVHARSWSIAYPVYLELWKPHDANI